MEIITRIRQESGRYFQSPLPDVYSGLANAFATRSYLFSHRPLSVWGLSHHSTGATQSFAQTAGSPWERFEEENKGIWEDRLDERLRGRFILEVRIADVYLKAKASFAPDDDDIAFDMSVFLRGMCKAAARYTARYADAVMSVHEMADLNGVNLRELSVAPPWREVKRPKFNYTIEAERDLVRFTYHTDPAQIRTIDDMVRTVARTCRAPSSLFCVDTRQAAASAKLVVAS
jgi:hypothetical protein